MRQDALHAAHAPEGAPTLTVGLDAGDRYCQLCVVDSAGEVIEEARIATTREALRRRFAGFVGTERVRVVIEASRRARTRRGSAACSRRSGARCS